MVTKIINKIAAYRIVAVPLAWALVIVGDKKKSYRVRYRAKILPERLEIRLPGDLFAKKLLYMKSIQGRDQVARTAALRGWHVFERPLPELFSAIIGENSIVFDIGANTGYYTLLAAARAQNVEVHAFEPVPKIKDILVENILINDFPDERVKISSYAVASESGEEEFYLPEGDHGLVETSASLNKDFRNKHAETFRVEVTTIDDYVEKNGLPSVDVIKVDVESMEHVVLKGAEKALRLYRPVIFLEVLDKANCEDLNEIVVGSDYVSVHLNGGQFNVQGIVNPNPANSNQMLWPREKADSLKDYADKVGYRICGEELAG